MRSAGSGENNFAFMASLHFSAYAQNFIKETEAKRLTETEKFRLYSRLG
jgi:hypothetical protein